MDIQIQEGENFIQLLKKIAKRVSESLASGAVVKSNDISTAVLRSMPPNSDDVPAMASAMGTVGVDDEGERDASLDELFWLGLEPDFDGKYTLEVEEDEAAGLGVETRDGPLVLGENPNGGGALPVGDAGARKEGCSCIYGNPCQDKYVCLNWTGRFEVAKKNGWKGF